jgi:hypothetical protein
MILPLWVVYHPTPYHHRITRPPPPAPAIPFRFINHSSLPSSFGFLTHPSLSHTHPQRPRTEGHRHRASSHIFSLSLSHPQRSAATATGRSGDPLLICPSSLHLAFTQANPTGRPDTPPYRRRGVVRRLRFRTRPKYISTCPHRNCDRPTDRSTSEKPIPNLPAQSGQPVQPRPT